MTERARSFGAIAAEYDRHRPGYPTAALEWALSPARGSVVLDLGAGTGKLTDAVLAVPGTAVIAVDPDPDMLAQLSARRPDVDARLGTAEEIPVGDAAVDAVVVGQAWHWFDKERAVPEIARVLRPGGVLAVVWNGEDPAATWIHDAWKAMHLEERPRIGSTEADDHPPGEPFVPPERRTFPNAVPTTIDGILATVATHSWALIIEPAERDATLDRLRTYLEARPETSGGTFALPVVTTVVRTLRK